MSDCEVNMDDMDDDEQLELMDSSADFVPGKKEKDKDEGRIRTAVRYGAHAS